MPDFTSLQNMDDLRRLAVWIQSAGSFTPYGMSNRRVAELLSSLPVKQVENELGKLTKSRFFSVAIQAKPGVFDSFLATHTAKALFTYLAVNGSKLLKDLIDRLRRSGSKEFSELDANMLKAEEVGMLSEHLTFHPDAVTPSSEGGSLSAAEEAEFKAYLADRARFEKLAARYLGRERLMVSGPDEPIFKP